MELGLFILRLYNLGIMGILLGSIMAETIQVDELKSRFNERDDSLTLKDIADLSEHIGIELVTFPDFKYKTTITNINHIG
jgi:hypothetical protein